MNLLEMINEEVKDKHFTKEELMRYIYIRTCEIFSFDSRYYYMELFPEVNIEDIINYVPKITNIKRREIVCKSYSRFILKRLLIDIANIEADSKNGIEHTYVVAKLNNEEYELDATMFDLARVKMGLVPTGYNKKTNISDKIKNEEYLKEIDKEIGYIETDYKKYNDELKDLNDKILKNYKIKYSDIYRKVADLLEKYPKSTKSYSDVTYLINQLQGGVIPIYSTRIKNMIYKNENGNISRIYGVMDNKNEYFLLDKETDNYTFKEIKEEDYKKLSKKLDYMKII